MRALGPGREIVVRSGMEPGREHLTHIIDSIYRYAVRSTQQNSDRSNFPRLVVIDVNLIPRGAADTVDIALCRSVIALSQRVPIVASSPLSFVAGSDGIRMSNYPSILRSVSDSREGCSKDIVRSEGNGPTNIWFGSSILGLDSDGVTRSIHLWDIVEDALDGQTHRIAGSVCSRLRFFRRKMIEWNWDACSRPRSQ